MPPKSKRPIYTKIGNIKPLGKSRLVKKAKPRPWRPFRISSYQLAERLPMAEGLVIHRRPTGRVDVAIDPRELRAVPKSKVHGTLPERIFYKELTKRKLFPDRDFDFQSSLLGGRLQLGGIVADFLFNQWRLIVRVQGPTHRTEAGILKDKQQMQLLADMGWTVYDLPEAIVYDMMALETWMRRYIDRHPSLGGGQVVGQTLFLAAGQMNFAWTAEEHTRVAALEDAVANVVRDMGRIEGRAVVTINGLSDIDTNLGLVQAGEFRVGNNKYPGNGFSGVRIGWPAFVYAGEDWHIAGVNNDELQFGLRATDGVAVAGGGAIRMDENGILFDVSGRWAFPEDTIIWSDGDYAWENIRGYIDFSLDESIIKDAVWGMTLTRTLNGTGPDGYDDAQLNFTTMATNLRRSDVLCRAHGSNDAMNYVSLRLNFRELFELNLNSGGNPSYYIIINKDTDDADFLVHGQTVNNLINVDASLNLFNAENLVVHNWIDFEDKAAPATPGSGYGRLYVNSDKIYFKDDGGNAFDLAAGGGDPFYVAYSTTSINNSVAWNTMGEITVPAGTMGINDLIDWQAYYYFYNNYGTTTMKIRAEIYDGTTTTYYPSSTGWNDSVTASANNRDYPIYLVFANTGSLSANSLIYGLREIDVMEAPAAMSWDTENDDIRIRIQMKMDVASTSFHLNPRYNRVHIYDAS